MRKLRKESGFTLIEILLVVVIMGVMLAVIVPRAYRANVDSKYNLVRQAGSELGGLVREWAEKNVVAQTDNSISTVKAYYDSLIPVDGGAAGDGGWVGEATGNWALRTRTVVGRYAPGATADTGPGNSVLDVTPVDKTPRNPFNGASYYTTASVPTTLTPNAPISGALYLTATPAYVGATASGQLNYSFLFQGVDSTGLTATAAGTFVYPQLTGTDIAADQAARHGIFLDRVR